MTDEEIKTLLVEWAVAKGGFFTDEELDSLTAVLEEHFDSPETATLQDARQVLGANNRIRAKGKEERG